MKKLILVLAVVIAGCGSGGSNVVPSNSTPVFSNHSTVSTPVMGVYSSTTVAPVIVTQPPPQYGSVTQDPGYQAWLQMQQQQQQQYTMTNYSSSK